MAGSTPSTGTYLSSYVPLAWLVGGAGRTVLGGSIDIRVLGTVLCVGGRRAGRRMLAAVGCGLLVLGATVAYAGAQNPSYGNESEYDLVFADILVHSPDPAATLRQLGLPASMADRRDTSAYVPGSLIGSPAWRAFERHGRTRLLGWYLGHPGAAAGALLRGTRAGWQARLGYLGYRLPGPGVRPWSDACEPCLYSAATSAVSGAGPAVTAGLWIAALGLAPLVRRRAGLGGVADAMVLLVALAAAALVAAVFGEGSYEEVKHLYLFYVADLLLLGLTAAGVVALIGAAAGSSRMRTRSPGRAWARRSTPASSTTAATG